MKGENPTIRGRTNIMQLLIFITASKKLLTKDPERLEEPAYNNRTNSNLPENQYHKV